MEGGREGEKDLSEGRVVGLDGAEGQVLTEAGCELLSEGGGEERHVVEEKGGGKRGTLLLLLLLLVVGVLVLVLVLLLLMMMTLRLLLTPAAAAAAAAASAAAGRLRASQREWQQSPQPQRLQKMFKSRPIVPIPARKVAPPQPPHLRVRKERLHLLHGA